jgi:hypothetical protein
MRGVSLVPIIILAKAQLLRGWEQHDGGDNRAAVKDMLRVDRFGQQLINGSQSQMMHGRIQRSGHGDRGTSGGSICCA